MLNYKENNYTAWTPVEDGKLAELALLPIQTQAQILGRTRSSIVGRRAKLRKEVILKTNQPDGPPAFWEGLTDEWKDTFYELCSNSLMDLAYLARIFGVSRLEIMQTFHYLKMEDPSLDAVQLKFKLATNELRDQYQKYRTLVVENDPMYAAFKPQRKYLNAATTKKVKQFYADAEADGFTNVEILPAFHPPTGDQSMFMCHDKAGRIDYLAIHRLVELPMITMVLNGDKPKKKKRSKNKRGKR